MNWAHWLPHLFTLYVGKRLCDYVLRKSEKIAANSLAELIRFGFRRLFKGKNMPPVSATQELGTFGSVTESFAAGVGSASAKAALPETAWGLGGSVQVETTLDSTKLIAYLAAKIGGPVPAEVAGFLEMALKAT